MATEPGSLEFKFGSRWSAGPQLDLSMADADGLNGYANATIQINWYPGSKP
jgi:hypothetical protein